VCDYLALISSTVGPINSVAVFRKKRQGKWVVWLALAAMWLTIGMPVISRSLPDGLASVDLGAWCTGHSQSDQKLSDHELQDQHRQAPSDPSAPLNKCGYCSLFCHSPLIAGHASLALAPCSLSAQAPIALAVPSGSNPRVLSARPRGPPSLA